MTESKENAVPEANAPVLTEEAKAVDQAESVMKFPIKVMGLTVPALPKEVAAIARAHFEDFDDSLTQVSFSRTRKYQCVTITVRARSREQLDDVYRALTASPMVKIVL